MQSLFLSILDFLFPPTTVMMKLRALTHEETLKLSPVQNTPFPFITSLFSYKDPLVTELIASIKYKKNQHATKCAAFALAEKLKDQKVALIPIPISKKRRRERGFNQCEVIINEMYTLNSNFEKRFDILLRPKDGDEQKMKDRKERLESKGIFRVNFIQFELPIVIIDDVCTTGATLNDARNALLEAGYADVSALTLAH